jgi:hypothetical protein
MRASWDRCDIMVPCQIYRQGNLGECVMVQSWSKVVVTFLGVDLLNTMVRSK